MQEVTDAHLWRVLDAATARGARSWAGARHALRYLRTVLAWALSRKLVERDPTMDLPLKDIRKRMKERARDRVLSPEELARLWRSLEADGDNVYSAVFRVAALTAQRLGEVAGMRWVDLDIARREWRQPTNKERSAHMVLLLAEAVAIIDARPRQPGNPSVFTTARGGPMGRRSGSFDRESARYGEKASVTNWAPRRVCPAPQPRSWPK